MRVQRCKGTRDMCPEEMARFRYVEGAFRDACLKWGYREVKTPTLEYMHLFTSTGTLTPGMLSKVYSFLDWDGWSGERVVLRPDATIPVARLYIDNLKEQGLARLCYVTNIFRFEETGKEARDRWQGGAELIGVSSPQADVELIVLAREILEKLGLKDIELRLTHAGLTRCLLQELKLSPREQAVVFDQILDGDSQALSRISAMSPGLGQAISSLLDLQGRSSGLLKNLKAMLGREIPDIAPQVDNFAEIVALLDEMGIKYSIDLTSGRGFAYYTGVIFQFFLGDDKVGGGGRYDALIPLMDGGNVPASGFGLYFDYLMRSLEQPGQSAGKVLVKMENGATRAFETLQRLHRAGLAAELKLDEQSEAGFRWVLNVRPAGLPFVLEDKAHRSRSEAASLEEVLRLLNRS